MGAWGEFGYTPRDRLFLNQVMRAGHAGGGGGVERWPSVCNSVEATVQCRTGWYRQAGKHLHAAKAADIAVLMGAWGEMGYARRDRLFLNQVMRAGSLGGAFGVGHDVCHSVVPLCSAGQVSTAQCSTEWRHGSGATVHGTNTSTVRSTARVGTESQAPTMEPGTHAATHVFNTWPVLLEPAISSLRHMQIWQE